MKIIKYKGYEGTAEIDLESMICRGKILFIEDFVTYIGDTPQGLVKAFEEAVDDYIQTCIELNREPKKALRGIFNVRVNPELHKAATMRALVDDTTLNDVVSQALDSYLNEKYVKEPTYILNRNFYKNIKTLPNAGSLHTASTALFQDVNKKNIDMFKIPMETMQ